MRPGTLDALAALYLSSAKRGVRAPRTYRLDSDGATLTVTVPAPTVLAEVEGLFPDGADAGIYRTGTAGLATASGAPMSWSMRDLADRLVERLAALPDRVDAGPAYGALRTLCRESTKFAPEYALDVVKVWRRSLPKVPEPEVRREPRVRRYPKDEAARKAERRARYRVQEEESSRYFFDGWRAHGWAMDEDGAPIDVPTPGTRAYAATLLARAVEVLEELVDAEETVDEAEQIPARVPGPRRFYGVGDEFLGRRRKTEDGRAYWTVPDDTEENEDVSLYTNEEIHEAIEIREIVARLREQRDRLQVRHVATGTDATVVPLRRSGS